MGERPGLSSAEHERMKALERENGELRKANEILRLASAFFVQAELDRRFKSKSVHRQAPPCLRRRSDLPRHACCAVGLLALCSAAA